MKQLMKRPRGVLIYGTGAMGLAMARLVVARGWRIAGALNRSGANKVGMDLGRLAGRTRWGVTVTDAEKANLADFDADIAIVAVSDWLDQTLPIHKRLLSAGLNVICLGCETSYPAAVSPEAAEEIDQLAKAHGVTLTGGGLWDSYRLWSLRILAGPCSALRGLRHQSLTDANRYGPTLLRTLRIGDDPAEFDGGGRSIYRVFLHQAVASLGLTVTAVHETAEATTSAQSIPCSSLGSVIEAGRITGRRSIIEVRTQEGVTATATIELRLTEPGEEEQIEWLVEGDPPARWRLSGLDTGHASASSMVNRIPDVIAAPPGLVTSDRLPPMRMAPIRGGNMNATA